MVRDTLRRLFHSVFIQLLLICLVAGLIIIFLVGGFFSHLFRKSAQSHLQKNVIQYLNYIVKDLGNPPSFQRASEIAKESGIQIRYQGAQGSWATSEKVPTLSELKAGKTDGCITVCRIYQDKHPIIIRQGSDAFILILKPEHTLAQGWQLQIVILTLLLTTVVLITYLTIRHIMRPLKFLSEGVQQIGKGQLDYQVPTAGSTEFCQLAQGFNTMTVRVRNMLHAKEQLLLDVSHELRSPLTRMKVALAMQEDTQVKTSLTDDVREMEAMVGELLEEARLRHATAGQLNIEAIAVKQLFEETGALHQGQSPGLRVGPVPDDATFQGELPLIKIVLNNVIANALKYSAAEGEPVSLSYRQLDGCAVIGVEDRGAGIPEEDLPYIFEPFYRVDKSRSKRTGGYGLGLSLCKTIMDAHQEKIEVRSTFGVGTTISLFFRQQRT